MSPTMSLTLKQEIEAIYEPLRGKTFRGSIHERKTTAVRTRGPRDVVTVYHKEFEVIELMKTIEVEVSKKFEPYDGEEVWKGITLNPEPRLWVVSLEESYEGERTTFTVDNIEVLTDLKWQGPYHAMVNITLVKARKKET